MAAGGVKGRPVEEVPYELKLNITDSEIVVVEDTSQWDTNAVILKVMYKLCRQICFITILTAPVYHIVFVTWHVMSLLLFL